MAAFGVLMLVTFVGMVPKCCLKYFKRNRALQSYLNSFAGGTFLAISMLQILPHAGSLYNKWAEDRGIILQELKFPYLFIILGYTFILMIDKVNNWTNGQIDDDTAETERDKETEMTT